MRKLSLPAALAIAMAALALPDTGGARAADLCKSRVEGSGTGRGPFGQGSKKARARAIESWETSAAVRFGPKYSSFDHAVAAKWDCYSGALQAKCVVTAVACK